MRHTTVAVVLRGALGIAVAAGALALRAASQAPPGHLASADSRAGAPAVVAGRPVEGTGSLLVERGVVRDGEVVTQSTARPDHPRRPLRAGEMLVHLETAHGEIDIAVHAERAPLTGVVYGLDVVRTIQQQPVEQQRLTPPVPILRAVRIH